MTTPRHPGLRPQAPRQGAGRPPGPTPRRTLRLTISLHPDELAAIEGQREGGETAAQAARRLALREIQASGRLSPSEQVAFDRFLREGYDAAEALVIVRAPGS
jgi:hypothetical protein